MGKFIDLTGQKFGRLTVLQRDGTSTHGKPAKWICRCDCGNITSVVSSALRNSYIISCGCAKSEQIRKVGQQNLGKRLKWNNYEMMDNYYKGYDNKGNYFIIDADDYDLVKKYCWRKDITGYWATKYANGSKRKQISLHRIIMLNHNLLIDKNKVVDHINRCRNDNRKSNLRLVSIKENNTNVSLSKNNTSGFKGVTYKNNKWYAYLKQNKKQIHLGSFYDKEEAIKARLQGELKYYGIEFAPQRHLFEQYGIGELNG